MRRSMYILLAFTALLTSMLSPTVPQALGQASEQCFSETDLCISGRFREYWQQNGGLEVFGLPISVSEPQPNRDTGQTYVTQPFERNRFELHPEKQAPYDVLLGRLGDERLRQQGIEWQTLPRESGAKPGCLWFEQTGHNVCDQSNKLGFKTYWETHGLKDAKLNAYGQSLALFGFPLTEAKMETNSSGDTVLTQWFERARFEWHPGKPDQFKVLLGLLGNEVTPIVQWRDDFNDGSFDQSKWQQPISPSSVYEQDGVLNLRVTADQTRGNQAYGEVAAVATDRPIKQVTFTIMLKSYGGRLLEHWLGYCAP